MTGRVCVVTGATAGIGKETARSQLKSIFIKTGTKRQSELVSMLLASPAYFVAQKQ